MLIDEKRFAAGDSLSVAVLNAYELNPKNGKVFELALKQQSLFLQIGIPLNDPKLKLSGAEEIETPLGKKKTTRYHLDSARDMNGWACTVWLSEDIPFGVAAFEVVSPPSEPKSPARYYRGRLLETGKDAKQTIVPLK